MAVDINLNVYVADAVQQCHKRDKAASDNSIIVLGSGFSNPNGVAVDRAGNVYVADSGNGERKEILAGNKGIIVLGTGFTMPTGVALDAAGDIYVADEGNSTVSKIPAGGGTAVAVGSGFHGPIGINVDPAGDIFIADAANNAVKLILASGGAPIKIGSGFNSPSGVTTDGSGNVYVADQFNNAVKEISLVGGYAIYPALPAGLKFSIATGVISGTPTAVSPATNYYITAFNASGYATTQLGVTVNALTISYTGPQVYTAGTAITTLKPAIGASTIPNQSYSTIPTTLNTTFNRPEGVAIDAAGNLYVADGGGRAVYMLPANGGAAVTVGSGFSQPLNIAVDASGDVYVADFSLNAVYEVPAGGGSQVTIAQNLNGPVGVALDASNNVFISAGGKQRSFANTGERRL